MKFLQICKIVYLININFHIRMLILTGQALFYLEINANLENMDIQETIEQIKRKLKEGSMITIDKGASSEENINLVLKDKMKYLTLKKLNKSDDKRIKIKKKGGFFF